MKHRLIPVVLTITSLAIATIACSMVGNLLPGGEEPAAEMEDLVEGLEATVEAIVPVESLEPLEALESLEPLENESPDDNSSEQIETDFPMPPGAENVMEMGSDSVNFQVEMSLQEVIAFYQDSLTQQGLTERDLLHVEAANTFSMVFDGSANDKALVIQGVDLGDGLVNVNIRYEDV